TTLAPASTTTMAPASTTTLTPTTTVADILPQRLAAPIAPPPDPRGYEDEIQLGGISIPKIGLEAPLLEGIRLTTLDNGPGHWPGTAMPGENGNVVVAAHRTSHGAAFRNIDQLVAGDLVQFSTAAGIIDYTVTGTQIVTPDAIWIVNPTENATATLFACHPLGSVSHRIVVNLELSQ
ncbi:MAG: sortase A, partial [Ilumatobacter sp.]